MNIDISKHSASSCKLTLMIYFVTYIIYTLNFKFQSSGFRFAMNNSPREQRNIYSHLPSASFPKSNVEEWYIGEPCFISSYVNMLISTCYICIRATWLGGLDNHVGLTEALFAVTC